MRFVALCLLVGVGYSLTWSVINAFSVQTAWQFLAGVILAAVFVPVIRWSPWRPDRLFGVVWAFFWYVGSMNLLIEGWIFIERPSSVVWHEAISGLGCSVVLAVLLVSLAKPLRITLPLQAHLPRPAGPKTRSLVWRVPVATFGYLFLYFLFGFVMYVFFLQPYYTDPAAPLRDNQEVAQTLGGWFLLIQIGRALGIVLVSLPVLYSLRTTRRNLAMTMVLLLWVVGGLSSLIVPSTSWWWPAQLSFFHSIEILFQNGGLGLLLVWLFRPRKAESPLQQNH